MRIQYSRVSRLSASSRLACALSLDKSCDIPGQHLPEMPRALAPAVALLLTSASLAQSFSREKCAEQVVVPGTPGVALAYDGGSPAVDWVAVLAPDTLHQRLEALLVELRDLSLALAPLVPFIWADIELEVVSDATHVPLINVTWDVGSSTADVERKLNPSIVSYWSSAAVAFASDPGGIGSRLLSQPLTAAEDYLPELVHSVKRPVWRQTLNPFRSVHAAFRLLDDDAPRPAVRCSVNCAWETRPVGAHPPTCGYFLPPPADVSLWYPVLFIAALLLWRSADSLSRNTALYYAGGWASAGSLLYACLDPTRASFQVFRGVFLSPSPSLSLCSTNCVAAGPFLRPAPFPPF